MKSLPVFFMNCFLACFLAGVGIPQALAEDIACEQTGAAHIWISPLNPKSGEPVKITSGISPAMFARLKKAQDHYPALIVEAEVSSLKDLQSANPTIQTVRFDKMEPPQREPQLV